MRGAAANHGIWIITGWVWIHNRPIRALPTSEPPDDIEHHLQGGNTMSKVLRFPKQTRNLTEEEWKFLDGGADRDRTCDLLIANETLCQLSYDPIPLNAGQR